MTEGSFATRERTWRVRIRSFCVLALASVACHRPTPAPDPSPVTTVAPAPSASAPAARTYAIRMRRPRRVGERSHVVLDDERDDRTSALAPGAAAPKDSNKSLHTHLEGTDVLVSLQADGHSPLTDDLTVTELWQIHDGLREVVARAGARISLTRAPKKRDAVVTVDGRPASKTVRDALERVMSLETHTGPSDDEIFGTKAQQPVGGEWGIDAALAARDLATRGIVVDPGNIEGKTRLTAVVSEGSVDCLAIENHLRVSALRSAGDLPPGSVVDDGSIDVVFHTSLPIDETRVEPKADMRIAMKGTFEVPTGKGTVKVTIDSVDFKQMVATP